MLDIATDIRNVFAKLGFERVLDSLRIENRVSRGFKSIYGDFFTVAELPARKTSIQTLFVKTTPCQAS
jgi:hypothetical protein